MQQSDRDFLEMIIQDRMQSHYSAFGAKKSPEELRQFDELERQFNAAVALLPAESAEIVAQYVQSIFDCDAAREEFFYKVGVLDGFQLYFLFQKLLKRIEIDPTR